MTVEEFLEEREDYPFLRFVADTLTAARFMVSAFILFLGLFSGPEALPAAVIATMAGWLTDTIDGPIARNSGGRQSWMGRLDFAADITMGYAFFLYLVITGLFPALPALILIVAIVSVVVIKPTHAVIQVVTAPFFALPVIAYTAFLATLLVFRWDHAVSDARNAREMASGGGDL